MCLDSLKPGLGNQTSAGIKLKFSGCIFGSDLAQRTVLPGNWLYKRYQSTKAGPCAPGRLG